MLRRILATWVFYVSCILLLGALFVAPKCKTFPEASHIGPSCAREDLKPPAILFLEEPSLPAGAVFSLCLVLVGAFFLTTKPTTDATCIPYVKTRAYTELPRHGPLKIQGYVFLFPPRSKIDTATL